MLPRQKRLLGAVREAGARIRLHICGQTRHLWNGYRQLPLDLVDVDHLVDMKEIREALGGNLCRCGTYPQHPKAIMEAAGILRDSEGGQ